MPNADREYWSDGMCFHPESLLIEVGSGADDIISLFDAEFADAVSTGRRVAALARYLHEEDHLRRTLGTSYGLLMHTVRSMLVPAFVGAFDRLVRSNSNVVPFGLKGSPPEGPLSQLYMVHCALSALDASVGSADFATAQGVFQRIATAAGAQLTDFRLMPPFQNESFSGQPLRLNGRATVLAGLHLLEFFALGEECNHIVGVSEDLAHVYRKYAMPEYGFAGAAWLNLFGTEFPDPGDQPGSEDRRAMAYRVFPMQAFAAADLALWPPFFPEGLTCGSLPLRWVDIHPGCRFLAVLSLLRDRKWNLTPIPASAEERSAVLLEFQRTVCSALGWPEPVTLAQAWVEYLDDSKIHEGVIRWPFSEKRGSQRVRATEKLLLLRLSSPGDMVLNMFDIHAPQDLPSVAGFIGTSDDGFGLELVSINGSDLVPFHVYSALRCACFDDPLYQRFQAFNSATREDACEALVGAYTALGGVAPAALESDLRRMLLCRADS